ncbi:MAG: hypothetical protein DRP63_06040 [Planctomycetota bacterium]|nr:MAG: hypothetical protein DRP63_06040 [Planctomycetota bacterium]
MLVANKIYYVDGVGGDDTNGGTGWSDAWKTIGKALSVAGDYDLVLVADATYNETDLNFNGKKICLSGVDHNTSGAQPVIDCQQAGRAFYFGSGETKDCVIDNFIIQSGRVEDAGGGAILCENNSSPTIANCVFQNNEVVDTNSSLDDCGGTIYCDSSSPAMNNCILWGNSARSSGNEIYIRDSGSSCTLNYCCVDNTGYGGQTSNITENNCIHSDPQFVDAANGDYHLKDTSPCIDAGANTLVPGAVGGDLDGNKRIVDGDNDGTATVDIGAYEKQ